MRRALGAHQHRSVLLLQRDEAAQHRLAAQRRELVHGLAAAGLNQEVEVERPGAQPPRQLEQRLDLVVVLLHHRRLHQHLEAARAADLERAHRSGKGAAAAAEAVVAFGVDGVEADGDATHAALDHLGGDGVGDQHAVGAHHHPQAGGGGGAGDLVDVAPQQRLAAGQDHHLRAEGGQLAEHRQALLGRQLLRRRLARFHVAVRAAQIAALRQVPGDERGAEGLHRFGVGWSRDRSSGCGPRDLLAGPRKAADTG